MEPLGSLSLDLLKHTSNFIGNPSFLLSIPKINFIGNSQQYPGTSDWVTINGEAEQPSWEVPYWQGQLVSHKCPTQMFLLSPRSVSQLPLLPPETSSFVVLKGQVVSSLSHQIRVLGSCHSQVPTGICASLLIGHQPSFSSRPATSVLILTRRPEQEH